jgi:hypothetical protein
MVVKIAGLFCVAQLIAAQQLIHEALNDFPEKTISVEYESLAALRSMPDFTKLQARYLGQPLTDLLAIFESAGIDSQQVNEIATGALALDATAARSYGVMAGTFSIPKKTLLKAKVDETTVYCLSSEKGGMCFVDLDGVNAAFGSFNHLRSMLEARQGVTRAASSNRYFADLLSSGEYSSAEVRGVAAGSEIAAYLSALLPDQLKSTATNWASFFPDINAFAYNIRPGTRATLDLEIECGSESAAFKLRQLLTGVATLQTAFGQKNKFENLNVQVSGTRVTTHLDSDMPLN